MSTGVLGDIWRSLVDSRWMIVAPLWLIVTLLRLRRAKLDRVRASAGGTFALLCLYGLLAVGAGVATASHATWASYLTKAAQCGFALTTVTLVLVILFDVFLPWFHLEPPRIVADLVAAASYLVAGLVLLHNWGVNLSGLIATSAVLTAIIGFSLQDTLGNLMSGMTLQLERSVRPGDWIRVGNDIGLVREVRWRQTTLETRNWETLIIPNGQLAKSSFFILGRREGQPVQLRQAIKFSVDFRTPPNDVIRVVEEALGRAPMEGVAREPSPNCVVEDISPSYCVFSVRYWLTALQTDEPINSQIRLRIFYALQRAGIGLAMPAHAIFMTHETDERKERKLRNDIETRAAALRQVDFFDALSPEEISDLAQGLRYSPYIAGEVLTQKGAIGHDLYLIDQGTVSVRVTEKDIQREVAVLTAGQFFGERSLITGEPRSATTVALTDVVCYRLAKVELERVLKKRPVLAEEMAEILSARTESLDLARQKFSSRAQTQAEAKSVLIGRIKDFFGL